MNAIVPVNTNAEAYRASTDAAGMCREIVMRTAKNISGRKHVSVEGWEAIAIAHGCAASALDVQRVNDEGMGGFKCVGVVRRMSDGQEIARGEGFLGDDEQMWSKRAVYARRAMCQTRAISRACRSAFAHVVVMIDQGLSTTPAEEMMVDAETGEIFESKPTHEPAARTKLDGPHPSKTALKAAVTKIVRAVLAAESIEAIDKIKTDEKHTINQARRDWPELIEGDPNVEEDIGLKGAFEKRRAELTPKERSEGFTMLLDTLNECTSSHDLKGWLEINGNFISELDGDESREFEDIYNGKEEAMKLVDQTTVGA